MTRSVATMTRLKLFLFLVPSLLSPFVVAAIPPVAIEAFQAIQQPAPLPGTNLTNGLGKIIFRVPGTDTIIHFSNFGKLLYQTDVSLCLLEGMSDLFALAVRNKGDDGLVLDKFKKSYGQVQFEVQSYHPPDFKMNTSTTVNVLRGIGLFTSLYGYYQFGLDIYDGKTKHVGIGQVI